MFSGFAPEADVEIHVGGDSGHSALIGILPHLEVIDEGRRLLILGKPEDMILEAQEVKLLVAVGLIESRCRLADRPPPPARRTPWRRP